MNIEMMHKIEVYLTNVAKNKQLVTYGELVRAFNLPSLGSKWHLHPLCKLFDEIDRADANNNRPFKTSIVVNNNKKVGAGFFTACINYKVPKVGPVLSEIDKDKLWLEEVRAVHAYNW
jgi:hypothetical protein